jgi:hypothetical protein
MERKSIDRTRSALPVAWQDREVRCQVIEKTSVDDLPATRFFPLYLRLISSRASFIGLLEIRISPRKGAFRSSVISIAPAAASAHRKNAVIAVPLRGAKRPKLKKRSVNLEWHCRRQLPGRAKQLGKKSRSYLDVEFRADGLPVKRRVNCRILVSIGSNVVDVHQRVPRVREIYSRRCEADVPSILAGRRIPLVRMNGSGVVAISLGPVK